MSGKTERTMTGPLRDVCVDSPFQTPIQDNTMPYPPMPGNGGATKYYRAAENIGFEPIAGMMAQYDMNGRLIRQMPVTRHLAAADTSQVYAYDQDGRLVDPVQVQAIVAALGTGWMDGGMRYNENGDLVLPSIED